MRNTDIDTVLDDFYSCQGFHFDIGEQKDVTIINTSSEETSDGYNLEYGNSEDRSSSKNRSNKNS